MIAPDHLVPDAIFADRCGHRFRLIDFSCGSFVGADGSLQGYGTATLERLPGKDGEQSPLLTIPLDGKGFLYPVTD